MSRIIVTGSHGLVGSAVVRQFRAEGHQVIRLVRREPVGDDEVRWDPESGRLDAAVFENAELVVHLAGANIAARRWSEQVKQRIRDSRVRGTELLGERMLQASSRPRVLLSASAIGFYGDRGDEELTESSPPGEGFLAEVCQQWERAAMAASEGGVRVVCMRFGMILSAAGGALAKMLPPFRLGVGGRVGTGRQYWSWITRRDVVDAIGFAWQNQELDGPVNFVAPRPVTNREFTAALGRALRRPTLFPLPAFMARLVLGEMADELLLASQRVYPEKLLAARFSFQDTALDQALAAVLSDATP